MGEILIYFLKYIAPTIGMLFGFWLISNGREGIIMGGIVLLFVGISVGQKMEKEKIN